MATNTIKLWIDAQKGFLYSDWQSNSGARNLTFLQGDTVQIELHLVRMSNGLNGLMEEVSFPDACTVRFAVGKIDSSPTSGSYTITYGGNTATVLATDTASIIQTKLNALASITSAGGVACTQISPTMVQVDFLQVGSNTTFTLDASGCLPPSTSRVITMRAGNSTTKGSYILKVKQSPVAYQDVWTDSPMPMIGVQTLIANQSKRVSISPDPKSGSWTMLGTEDIQTQANANGGVVTSSMWSNNVTQIFASDALATDIGFTNFQYAVSKVDNYTWDFAIKSSGGSPPSGYTMPLSVAGSGLLGWKSKVAYVSFNTAEIEYLLNGAGSVATNLEIQVSDGAGNNWTVLQTQCVINNDLIDASGFDALSFHESVPEAPVDGNQYTRTNATWTQLSIDGGTY